MNCWELLGVGLFSVAHLECSSTRQSAQQPGMVAPVGWDGSIEYESLPIACGHMAAALTWQSQHGMRCPQLLGALQSPTQLHNSATPTVVLSELRGAALCSEQLGTFRSSLHYPNADKCNSAPRPGTCAACTCPGEMQRPHMGQEPTAAGTCSRHSPSSPNCHCGGCN